MAVALQQVGTVLMVGGGVELPGPGGLKVV